jgi:hypothetical protein
MVADIHPQPLDAGRDVLNSQPRLAVTRAGYVSGAIKMSSKLLSSG